MRSIPALYEGKQYASRLEARWMVYWQMLGVEAIYEPEVLELDGEPPLTYIPDFYLPSMRSWVEIKGEVVSDQVALLTLEKCRRLAIQSNRPVILCYEEPYKPSCAVFWGTKMYSRCVWTYCGHCGHIAISFDGLVRCPNRKEHQPEGIGIQGCRERSRLHYAAGMTARKTRFGWKKAS